MPCRHSARHKRAHKAHRRPVHHSAAKCEHHIKTSSAPLRRAHDARAAQLRLPPIRARCARMGYPAAAATSRPPRLSANIAALPSALFVRCAPIPGRPWLPPAAFPLALPLLLPPPALLAREFRIETARRLFGVVLFLHICEGESSRGEPRRATPPVGGTARPCFRLFPLWFACRAPHTPTRRPKARGAQ